MDVSRIVRAANDEVLTFETAIPRPIMRTVRNEASPPVIFPMRGVAPKRRRLAFDEGREREAVALRGNRQPHRFAERRENIDILRERIDDRVAHRTAAWIAQDAGNVKRLLEEAEFFEKPMISQLLAVIGGDDDERVLPLAG